jgi:small nuclear ribonucleoprotein (snRNP)-like protein
VAVVAVEVEEITVAGVEDTVEEGRARVLRRLRDPRKRTFSTCRSTWISRSMSSSVEEEKVRIITLNECAEAYPLLVTGTLKGFDQLMNLVLDDVKELLRGKFWRETWERAQAYMF